ncbi:glyoxalase [Arthrobacter sp. MYb227]|uniref:VOC family protein n=1 Tax=Arthrobacter sp. MYb227 TaxID=1848601 RepID=UPI000CFCBF08|nr:VOC family protein [Arthrobacter sp. MYb227]PQZ92922.1 glyoxalase [Arthrobacter sp. MYb227]
MALRVVQVNFKARNEIALGNFWARALEWEISSEAPGVMNIEPPNFTWPEPTALSIDVVRVPDPQTVAYRAHLDLATTSLEHQAKLIERLVSLGATHVDIGQCDVPWAVMSDPEGNLFCVLEPRAIYKDTGPIAAVVVHCQKPQTLGKFWDQATDWSLIESDTDFVSLRSAAGVGPYLEFLRADAPIRSTGRMHLDLKPYAGNDQAAEVARLIGLGAREIDLGQGQVSWVCMSDPEGNDFCVLVAG